MAHWLTAGLYNINKYIDTYIRAHKASHTSMNTTCNFRKRRKKYPWVCFTHMIVIMFRGLVTTTFCVTCIFNISSQLLSSLPLLSFPFFSLHPNCYPYQRDFIEQRIMFVSCICSSGFRLFMSSLHSVSASESVCVWVRAYE